MGERGREAWKRESERKERMKGGREKGEGNNRECVDERREKREREEGKRLEKWRGEEKIHGNG